jgi:hypothetical protein
MQKRGYERETAKEKSKICSKTSRLRALLPFLEDVVRVERSLLTCTVDERLPARRPVCTRNWEGRKGEKGQQNVERREETARPTTITCMKR